MTKAQKSSRRMRGFERASGLLQSRVRSASQGRGFEVTRLLTHWAEVVGQDIAAIARPVNVSYGRGNFGATLTLLTTGAQAPMLQMQLDKVKERVNACYGYAAIRHIRLTQTAPTGFAEGQAAFAPAEKTPAEPDPQVVARAERTAADVEDDGLRRALAQLGGHILSKKSQS